MKPNKNYKLVKSNEFANNSKPFSTQTAVKILAAILAGTITITGIIGLSNVIKNKDNPERCQDKIVECYGEDSLENNVLNYILLSKKLNELNLDKYITSDYLYKMYNCKQDLCSTYDLDLLINKYKELEKGFDKQDLVTNAEFISLVLNLSIQQACVNSYIYNFGYEIAYNNITSATKKYVAEIFGITDYNNILLYDSSNGYRVTYDGNDCTINDKNVGEGISYMIKTKIDYDKDSSDNLSYNEERNKNITGALVEATRLNNRVNNKNLYSERYESKLKN